MIKTISERKNLTSRLSKFFVINLFYIYDSS